MSAPADSKRPAKVFYDGACPLCSREIAFYRRRRGAEKISWVDINRFPSEELAPGLTKSRALQRLHIMNERGELVSGGAAFTHIWSLLPAFSWLAPLFSTAPMARLLEWIYGRFLILRRRLVAYL